MQTEPNNMAEQQDPSVTPEPGLGVRLRTRRESLGISLDAVAERTRIRRSYLDALEAERFEDLPASAYAVGFLRTYAGLLELNPEQVVTEFRQMAANGFVPSGQDGGLAPASTDHRIAGPKGRHRYWILVILMLGVALAVWKLDRFERHGEQAPVDKSPSVVTEEIVSAEDAVPDVHEVETAVAPPSVAGDRPVAEAASPAVEDAEAAAPMAPPGVERLVSSTEDSTPATTGGQGTSAVMSVPLPAGGAVFRVKSVGTGGLSIVVDDLEERRYDMYPEMAMSWSIRRFARVRINITGGLQAWLDDRPLALQEDAEVVFGQMDQTP